jgi:hypothetical protein
MTSGVKGSNTVQQNNFVGNGFYRSWSGNDGKFENYAGGQRLKWNNFDLIVESRQRSTDAAEITFTGGMPTSFPTRLSWNAPDAQLVFTSNDQLGLLSKLMKEIKGCDFNLAVETSQAKQTVSMAADALTKFGRSILALKRGDFATAARQLGVKPRPSRLKVSDISGRWLELQYGWLPAIGDVFETAKLFENISKGPRSKLIRVKIWKGGQFEGSQIPVFYSWKYQELLRRIIHYEMYEEMSAPRQMGLEDPLSIIWENIPYSFVVDWFLPIGSYIENLAAIPKLKGRFLTTDIRKREGAGKAVKGSATNVQKYVDFGYDSHTQTTVHRVFSNDLAVPFPNFTTGGLGGFGPRFWNAVSLAHQRFTK